MKTIGPTFGEELRAAGLLGLPFSWESNGEFCGVENISPEDAAKLQSVIDAHRPTKGFVPQTVTARQARIALLAAGLLPAVESAVKAAGGSTKITWEYATEINRTDALIETLGATLGLTDAAIDLLFTQASDIK